MGKEENFTQKLNISVLDKNVSVLKMRLRKEMYRSCIHIETQKKNVSVVSHH